MDESSGHHFRLSLPLLLSVGASAALIVLSGSGASSQSAGMVIPIGKMRLGAPPVGFSFARTGQGRPGEWLVVIDETGFDYRVIEQTSTDQTDYRFPLAVLDGIVAENVDVSVSFRPIAGRIDQAGGIAVRVLDPDNYYVVRANAIEDNVRLYRVVKGRREQIEGVNIKVVGKAWHTLRLKAEGAIFTVGFDGKTLFKAADATITAPGKIALWTKADSVTRFDQLAVDVLP